MLQCTKRNAVMHHCCFKNEQAVIIYAATKRRTNEQVSTTMSLIQNIRNWRRYRETVNELSRLSNRELSDLGLARSDIPYVARKASF